VGLLRFFGVLAQISSLVLGLTVLAWGNSIPDLITDVAMARTGYDAELASDLLWRPCEWPVSNRATAHGRGMSYNMIPTAQLAAARSISTLQSAGLGTWPSQPALRGRCATS
jgi:Sodium/calcium exchanger protein